MKKTYIIMLASSLFIAHALYGMNRPDLFQLVSKQDTQALGAALRENPCLINCRHVKNVTLLHYAKDVPTAEILSSYGANVNEIDDMGWTPLHYAASKNNVELAQFLILNGAQINGFDSTENIDFKNTKIKNTPLHIAAFYNCDKVALLLIEKGADIDGLNISGEKPIDIAKSLKNIHIVAILKEAQTKKSQASIVMPGH